MLKRSLILPVLIAFFLAGTVHAETPGGIWTFITQEQPLVVAHRGASSLAPENTMAAVRKALELNVDIIEIDVHRSYDGELVVIHDDTVNRTTSGKGRVKDFTLD